MSITINNVQDSIEAFLKSEIKISGNYDLFGKSTMVSPVGDKDTGLDIIPKIEVMVRTMGIHRKDRGTDVQFKEYFETDNNYFEKKLDIPVKVNYGIFLYANSNEQMNEMLFEMLRTPDRGTLSINGCKIDYQMDFLANQKLKDKVDVYQAEFIFTCLWDAEQRKDEIKKTGKIEDPIIEQTDQIDDL